MADDYSKPLTDDEWAELQQNRETLRDALNGPRGAEVRQALDDFVKFPPKSGKVT